jgi:hypothetical protein
MTKTPSAFPARPSFLPSFPPSCRPALAALIVAATACGGLQQGEPPTGTEPSLEGPFVPIYRQMTGEIQNAVQALSGEEGGEGGDPVLGGSSSRHFYLAVHKQELGERWFLSAFLSQIHPGAVPGGAGASMGTRIVSFRIQNGKLFLFDVADGNVWSETFRPEVLLEAYPIVQGFAAFEQLPQASDYVLIDPAGGLNRFNLMTDVGVPIKVELTFSQRFRKLPDGATFDQVFTGIETFLLTVQPDVAVEQTARVAGTLTVALRRYQEGPGYTPTAMPPREHYFRSDPRRTPGTGETVEVAARWAIRPGAPPIVWSISPVAERVRQDPALADIDFVGAVKTGIESWNHAFGFPALEARLAEEGESHGDDDVNYFIFDSDQSFPAAFADWRSNPNTGEIRGASVFFPLGFLSAVPPPAPTVSVDEPAEPPLPGPHLPVPGGLRWGNLKRESLCDLTLPSLAEVLSAEAPVDAPAATYKEKVERYFASIAAHEIGHTLGLRHNFKGSLRPVSSSVMDYLVADDHIAVAGQPQSYDIAAIRYLYGLSADLPADPFCTDDDLQPDPDCRTFDRGQDPFSDWVVPRYRQAVEPFIKGTSASFVISRVDNLIQYVRVGAVPDGRRQAWETLIAPIKAPLETPPDAPPTFAARVNSVARLVFSRLFLPVERGSPFPGHPPLPPIPAPPLHASLVPAAAAELGANLLDVDRLRSFAVRRLAADILKRMQRIEALAVLTQSRDHLAETLPGLSGPVALETQDLLNRVQRYVSSYFE